MTSKPRSQRGSSGCPPRPPTQDTHYGTRTEAQATQRGHAQLSQLGPSHGHQEPPDSREGASSRTPPQPFLRERGGNRSALDHGLLVTRQQILEGGIATDSKVDTQGVYFVLIRSGCWDRVPQTARLVDSRQGPLTAPEAARTRGGSLLTQGRPSARCALWGLFDKGAKPCREAPPS